MIQLLTQDPSLKERLASMMPTPGELIPRKRIVRPLRRFRWHGKLLTVPEIAARTGKSIGTVRQILHRLKQYEELK